MVRSAADPSPTAPPNLAIAARTMLTELKEAHSSLGLAMRVLEVLTSGPLADRDRYCAARWRISQSSLSRRTLWGKIYRRLVAEVGPRDAAALNDLQADEMRMLHCSAAHVGRWTMAEIDRDWAGYCRASEAVRRQLSARTDAERRLLYPMLERLSSAGEACAPATERRAAAPAFAADRLSATRSPSAPS